MSKTFEEMTKAELQDVAKLYKLEDKIREVADAEAKEAGKQVPKVPNNDVYIKVLNAFKDERAEGMPKPAKDGEVGNEFSSAGKTMKQVKKDYATSKQRVTVTDHNSNTSTEEELTDRLIPVRWGNKSGRYTDHIPVHGEPTHVRQGAIDVLRDAKMTLNQKNKSGLRNRFKVTEETPVTEAELALQAEQQASRKAR